MLNLKNNARRLRTMRSVKTGRSLFSTIRCLSLLCIYGSLITLPTNSCAQNSDDPVVAALSGRHMNISIEQLEELAGGEDALVETLLQIRTNEQPPFAGIRAEKILLHYAHRSDVQEALEADIKSTQYKGLARTVTVHLDKVSDASARRKLAQKAITRAENDDEFKPYAKQLLKSKDAQVQSLAKQAFN